MHQKAYSFERSRSGGSLQKLDSCNSRRTSLKLKALIFLFLNFAASSSGQDSLKYSIYYPDGKKYTGITRDFDQLNNEFEEKGRVWLYTVKDEKTARPTVIAFKLFTNIPLWIYTADDSSQIKSLIKSVSFDELMRSGLDSELKKHIKKGTLSDVFILETLGPPDKLKYFDEKNKKVSQWTYSKLHLYLIFTNRIMSNYIKMSDYH